MHLAPSAGDVLHVLNGDATYLALQPLQLPGRALVWRDALIEGPARGGLKTLDDWQHRAKTLAGLGIDPGQYLEGVRGFLKDFAAAGAEDEVVLWFEEDLFCQLPLCYLLSLKASGAKWAVVCPADPLGVARPDRLAVLYDERRAADDPLVQLATRAWDAYSASDAARVVELLGEADFSAWPLLRRGLLAHLARFPGAANGLNDVEQALLGSLQEQARTFQDIYAEFARSDLNRVYGLGDLQVASLLHSLQETEAPLVRVDGLRAGGLSRETPASMAAWTVSLTRLGRAVLAGEKDAVALGALPDRWLGGAKVGAGQKAWRWDASSQRLSARA